jgi:glycosyltransferase involved in cell wall biosynthesis
LPFSFILFPEKMKVLMFGWEFPPHISGGLGTACYGLTKGLSGFRDVEVTFVVPKAWGDEVQSGVTLLGADRIPVIRKQIQFADIESKVDYYELQSELIPYLGTNEFYELKSNLSSGEGRLVETTEEGKFIFDGGYGWNLFQEIQNYAIVAETIARELEFDVIHVHDWMTFPAGMAVKRISGKPLVVHVHSTEFDRSGQGVNPMVCALEKQGLDAADQVIAVSNLTRNILISNYSTLPEKIITVHNAVEPVDRKLQVKHKKPGKKKTVAFLGRVTMQKGTEYFVDAADMVLRRMKNVRFVLAGKGDLLNAMIKRSIDLGISSKISFPGFLQDSEVSELFRKSDVFVMPSVSEPFGIVVLEAMQAGVPGIISKQSGAAEVVKNGVKIDYWDVAGIADAICRLLNEPQLANDLAKKGKLEVEQLVWKDAATKIRDIYTTLINGNLKKCEAESKLVQTKSRIKRFDQKKKKDSSKNNE